MFVRATLVWIFPFLICPGVEISHSSFRSTILMVDAVNSCLCSQHHESPLGYTDVLRLTCRISLIVYAM